MNNSDRLAGDGYQQDDFSSSVYAIEPSLIPPIMRTSAPAGYQAPLGFGDEVPSVFQAVNVGSDHGGSSREHQHQVQYYYPTLDIQQGGASTFYSNNGLGELDVTVIPDNNPFLNGLFTTYIEPRQVTHHSNLQSATSSTNSSSWNSNQQDRVRGFNPDRNDTQGGGRDMVVGPQQGYASAIEYPLQASPMVPLPEDNAFREPSGQSRSKSRKRFLCQSCGKRFSNSNEHPKETCNQAGIPPLAGSLKRRLLSSTKGNNSQDDVDAISSGQTSTSLRKPVRRSYVRKDPYARTNIPTTSIPRPITDSSYFAAPVAPSEISRPTAPATSSSYERGKPRNKWIPQSLLYFSNSGQLASVAPFCQSADLEMLRNRVTVPAPPIVSGSFVPLGVADVHIPTIQVGGGVTPMPMTSLKSLMGEPAATTTNSQAGPSSKATSSHVTVGVESSRRDLQPRDEQFRQKTSGVPGVGEWHEVHVASQMKAVPDTLHPNSIHPNGIWFEERDSRKPCEMYPYHPAFWRRVLPGPGMADVHG
ncbi:hypothetical protein FRB94_000507 [Tulasnella sp. JGI-2019a]|nr:hypothetical protein FRB94_000507 [Tulasnella sp. JGI-2019a]